MNRPLEPTFDQRIADWLEDDPTLAPREVLGTVVAALPSITQRRASRVPWRLPTMLNNRLAVAALATVLVVAIGGFALSRLTVPGPGGPSPMPTSTPTATPLPSVAASPSPANPTITTSDVGRALEPGTYRIDAFAAPLSVTLPPNWIVSELSENILGFQRLGGGNVNLALIVLDQVYPDPCRTTDGPSPVAPGVDALVAAFSTMPGFSVTDRREATVGGAAGTAFTISNSIDPAGAGCSQGKLLLGTYDRDGTDIDVEMFGGEQDRFWVVDAGGVRVLLAITDTPDIVAGAQPVLDSLAFDGGSSD
jgi:hypothetical protein